jgi:acyl-CoA dehydrogenase
MWCRIVEVAQTKLASGAGDAARMKAKLVTARFFMERMLPEAGAHLARIQSGAASVMELPADEF